MKMIKVDYNSKELLKKGCDWCLEDLKERYGEDQEFESSEECTYKDICAILGIYNTEITKNEYKERAGVCF